MEIYLSGNSSIVSSSCVSKIVEVTKRFTLPVNSDACLPFTRGPSPGNVSKSGYVTSYFASRWCYTAIIWEISSRIYSPCFTSCRIVGSRCFSRITKITKRLTLSVNLDISVIFIPVFGIRNSFIAGSIVTLSFCISMILTGSRCSQILTSIIESVTVNVINVYIWIGKIENNPMHEYITAKNTRMCSGIRSTGVFWGYRPPRVTGNQRGIGCVHQCEIYPACQPDYGNITHTGPLIGLVAPRTVTPVAGHSYMQYTRSGDRA